MTRSADEMASHVRVVGILSILWGLLTLLVLLIVRWVVGLAAFPNTPETVVVWLSPFGLILVVILLQSLVAVAGGIGLLKQQAWGQPTTIIASALALLSFPLGTAFGVYALWVLTRPGARDHLGIET